MNTLEPPPTDEAELRLLTEKVGEASGAKMVLVFGSVARDESGPESDLDLLPVLDGDANLLGAALEGRVVLSGGRYAVNIVPIRERSLTA